MLKQTAMKQVGSHGTKLTVTVGNWSFIAKQPKRNWKK